MECEKNLAVGCGIVVENKLYFSNRTFNGLFCYEFDKRKTVFLDFFENEEKDKRRIHNFCFCYGEKIFFIPDYGKHLHIYNMRTKSQSCILIKSKIGNERTFADAQMLDNVLWLFPFRSKELLMKLEVDTLRLTEFDWLNGCDFKIVLAAELETQAMKAIGSERQAILLCDNWYPKVEVTALVEQFENLEMVCNARVDTAPYGLPPSKTGKRGRSRKRGSRIQLKDIILSEPEHGDWLISMMLVITNLWKRKWHTLWLPPPKRKGRPPLVFMYD